MDAKYHETPADVGLRLKKMLGLQLHIQRLIHFCTSFKENLGTVFKQGEGKFGEKTVQCTMYNLQENLEKNIQIPRKVEKQNVQRQGKIGNTMYRFKGKCRDTMYKFKGKCDMLWATHVRCAIKDCHELELIRFLIASSSKRVRKEVCELC